MEAKVVLDSDMGNTDASQPCGVSRTEFGPCEFSISKRTVGIAFDIHFIKKLTTTNNSEADSAMKQRKERMKAQIQRGIKTGHPLLSTLFKTPIIITQSGNIPNITTNLGVCSSLSLSPNPHFFVSDY
ncbi:hypothetical protein Ahy_B04g069316 isoform B [Arachis hypogaea]|uniref:Uncharacterized protein n=1 Tax=Arachis hypogaea TaxID=3818 RepID=A0A444ZCC2_ARAHY|nr:hypothetical protein Ahy_B04g069316 isoform B [Arachis hypogaea]